MSVMDFPGSEEGGAGSDGGSCAVLGAESFSERYTFEVPGSDRLVSIMFFPNLPPNFNWPTFCVLGRGMTGSTTRIMSESSSSESESGEECVGSEGRDDTSSLSFAATVGMSDVFLRELGALKGEGVALSG